MSRLLPSTVLRMLNPRPIFAFLVAVALSTGAAARAETYAAAREAALGHAPDAEARLRAVAEDAGASPVDRRDAWHLLARLLDKASPPRPTEAIAAWRHALELGLSKEAPSALLDALRFGLATALVASGATSDEPLGLLEAVERDVYSNLRVDAAWGRARYLDQLGRSKDAKKLYEAIIDRWPDAPIVRAVKVRIAALDVAAGKPDRARAVLADLRREAPGSMAAKEAGVLLASVGMGGSEVARVPLADIAWLLEERRYPEADRALAAWLEPEPAADAPRDVREAWLRALGLKLDSDWENLRLDDALAVHEKLKAHKKPGLSQDKLIRLHAYDGDFDKALDLLKDKFGRKKTRAYHEALGDLYYEFGRFKEAYEAYTKAWSRAGREAPQTERISWCLLRMGKGDKARSLWGAGAKARGFNKNLFSRYWYARSLMLSGKNDEAKPILEALVEDAPLEYYGYQAWSRLQDMAGTAPAGVTPPPPQAVSAAGARMGTPKLEAPDLTPTVAWSEAALHPDWDAAPRPVALPELEAAVASFAAAWGDTAEEARRAAELVHLGDVAGASGELRVIDMDLRAMRNAASLGARARSDLLDNRSAPKARGGASIREAGRKNATQVGNFKRRAGELRKDLRGLQLMFADPYAIRRAAVDKDGSTLTPEILDGASGKGYYPLAYPEIVEPLTRQFGLPAYFVYAIMTVESAFHSGAVSVANAYGLVQVIPRTGYNLAQELGYLDFAPELLLEPPVSIYFGGYYLARLLSRFRGQEPLAAAAYNAGPHRVASWLRARGQIPLDMFIEDIPYDQARNYTKTVLEHIAAYRRIYAGETHLYIRNTIRTDEGDGPNY
ncbi:MAG: transglycosylase SLT domain-containing protein [Myxococcota bacterium]